METTIDPKALAMTLTNEQFMELLRQVIKEAIEGVEKGKKEEEAYYSPQEVCEKYGFSETTLYRWRKAGLLVANKQGGLLKYRRSDINDFRNHKSEI